MVKILKILKWAHLGIYFIENDEIRYGWGFMLLTRNLLHWNCRSKVRLSIYSIEKCRNKVRLKIYFIEEVKIGYDLTQVRQDWRFVLLYTKKIDTAVDLFHSKCWNTLQLRIYSIQNAEIKYIYEFIQMKKVKIKHNLGFIPLKRLK